LHAGRRALQDRNVADEAPKPDALLPVARNFSLSLAERVRAAEGVPAHIRRKREIEDRFDAVVRHLRQRRAGGATLDELRRQAARVELARLNELIEKHNRYYPIEANLPIDPRSGRSLDNGRIFEKLPLLTPEHLLAHVI
jgi:hypothetical protein